MSKLAGDGDTEGGTAAGKGKGRGGGSAERDSGPSAGYASRLAARVRPNIVYPDQITGNAAAEVEVRTSPDGTIISRRLTKSSGVKAWDDAVLRALDKTEVLPKDIDGRVPSIIPFSFRPRD